MGAVGGAHVRAATNTYLRFPCHARCVGVTFGG